MNSLRSLLALAALTAAAPFLSAVETPAAATPADAYPLRTCVVSGDKLGEMGDPVKYVYKEAGKPDRLIEFCCKDCVKDFEKDPAKYLARFDAAVAGHPVAAKAEDNAPADCCAAGSALVKTYLPIADALAADNLPQAQKAAAGLAKQTDSNGMKALYQPSLAIVHATDLKTARAAFKTLSARIEPLAAGTKDYVVMHCPMAEADWVQTGTAVRNPYFGQMMLTCGEPKEPATK